MINGPYFLVLVEYLNGNRLIFAQTVNFNALHLRKMRSVSHCYVISSRKHAHIFNMICFLFITVNVQSKVTKLISGRSIDFLAIALPTGKTTFTSFLSSSLIPTQFRYFWLQVEPNAWIRSSFRFDIVSILFKEWHTKSNKLMYML